MDAPAVGARELVLRLVREVAQSAVERVAEDHLPGPSGDAVWAERHTIASAIAEDWSRMTAEEPGLDEAFERVVALAELGAAVDPVDAAATRAVVVGDRGGERECVCGHSLDEHDFERHEHQQGSFCERCGCREFRHAPDAPPAEPSGPTRHRFVTMPGTGGGKYGAYGVCSLCGEVSNPAVPTSCRGARQTYTAPAEEGPHA